jgi:hypothetical protein
MLVIPSTSGNSPPIRFPRAYNRVKEFLKDMLKRILERYRTHPNEAMHPVIKELGAVKTVEGFRTQLQAFWRNEWPFNQPVVKGDPLAWWKNLELHPHARVLAVRFLYVEAYFLQLTTSSLKLLSIKLFSMTINSMADERTNSYLTWLNSPLRGKQHSETLINMIQVGQWHKIHVRSRQIQSQREILTLLYLRPESNQNPPAFSESNLMSSVELATATHRGSGIWVHL